MMPIMTVTFIIKFIGAVEYYEVHRLTKLYHKRI